MRNRLQTKHLCLYLLFKVLAVARIFGFFLCRRISRTGHTEYSVSHTEYHIQDSLGFGAGPPLQGSASIIEPLNARKRIGDQLNQNRATRIFRDSCISSVILLRDISDDPTEITCRSLVSSASPLPSFRPFSKQEKLVIFWQKCNTSSSTPPLSHKVIQFLKM